MTERKEEDFVDESISLDGIYSECNEHLREQDRKRDQIIGFYGAIIGIIIGNIENILKIQHIYIMYTFFVIASWILASILMKYMYWHTIYNYSAITLQNIMFFKQTKIKQRVVNEIFYKLSEDENFNFRKYMEKTESKIINLYLMISSMNHFILAYLIAKQTKISFNILLIIAIVVTILYIIIVNYKGYKSLKNVFKSNQDYNKVPSWCINLYGREDFIKSRLKEV